MNADTNTIGTITTSDLTAAGTDAVQVVTRSAFSQFGRSEVLWTKERVATKGKNAGTLVPAKIVGESIAFHRETYTELKAKLTQQVKDKTLSSKDKKAILGAALRGEAAEAANMAAAAVMQKAFSLGGAAQQAVVKNGKLTLEIQLPEHNAGRASAEELRLRQENAALKAQVAGLSAKLDAIIAKLGA